MDALSLLPLSRFRRSTKVRQPLVLLALLTASFSPIVDAQPQFGVPSPVAPVVQPAPADMHYRLQQVHFSTPLQTSTGAGKAEVRDVLEVVVEGHGFRMGATGSRLILNGILTDRTFVSEDGRTLTGAFFGTTMEMLAEAAKKGGGWRLLMEENVGAPVQLVIPPRQLDQKGNPVVEQTRR